MNNLMLRLVNLLGADDAAGTNVPWLENLLTSVKSIIDGIIVPILIIVATVGIVYSIVLGVNYAKAETSDQKEEAKKRIINVVVGCLLMIGLMLLLYAFISYAPTIFGWVQTGIQDPSAKA